MGRDADAGLGPDARRRLGAPALLLLALLAAGVRVGYELTLRADDGPVGVMYGALVGDERAYDHLARQVASGALERERAFYQEPLYGWLVGQLYRLLPPSPVEDTPSVILRETPQHVAVWIQHGLGVVIALLVAGLGARCIGRAAGLLAGLFAALSGPLVFHEGQLLKATLALAVFTLALHLWLSLLAARARGAPAGSTLVRAAVLGAVVGAGILLRGNLYLLLALVVLSLLVGALRRGRRSDAARAGRADAAAEPAVATAVPGAAQAAGADGDPRSAPSAERAARPALALACAAVVVAAAALAIAPVTLHNLRRGDRVLTTYQAGTNVALGQPDHDNVLAGVVYEPLRAGRGDALFEEHDAVALAEQAAGRRLHGHEISSWWWRQAVRRVLARPGVALARVGLKLVYLFHGAEVGDVKDWPFYRGAVPWLSTPLSDLRWLGPLALVGFVWLPWRRRELAVVRSGVLVVAATLALFYVMARYRLTALPCLWVLAAGTITEGARWLAGPARGAVKAAAVAGVVALLSLAQYDPLAHAGFTRRPWHGWLLDTFVVEQTAWSNYASIEKFLAAEEDEPTAAREHRARAVAAARRALELAPKYPNARLILIHALDLTSEALGPPLPGAEDEAWRLMLLMEGARSGKEVVELLERDRASIAAACAALRRAPSIPGGEAYAATTLAQACRRVAQDLREPHELALALDLLDRSLALDPDEPEAHLQRGWVLKKLDRLAEAEAAYRAALAGGIDTVELHNNLGNTLRAMGRIDEALEHFDRALALSPGHPGVLRNRLAAEQQRAGADG